MELSPSTAEKVWLALEKLLKNGDAKARAAIELLLHRCPELRNV